MERNWKKMSIMVAVLVSAALLVGCADVPAPDTSSAQAAYDAAVQAGAETMAADQLSQAKTALDEMNAELAAQQAKAGYSRKYEKAVELMNSVVEKANAAAETAKAAKEQKRAEAETVKNDVGTVYTAAETMMTEINNCAKKPKNFDALMAPLQTEWETLATEWGAVTSAYDSGAYDDVKTKAEEFRGKITTFSESLTAAKGKLKGC